jgi:hypothetical protein
MSLQRRHPMRRALALVVVVVLSAVSCGGDNGGSPAAPTPQIPAVDGNYSGNITITFPELNTSLTCPASTVVTQSGRTVNVAPLILGGQCGNQSVPLGQVTIDNTGAIEGGGATGTYNEPSCGTYSYSGSGGFFGREFRISLSATSATCYNFNFTAVLTR